MSVAVSRAALLLFGAWLAEGIAAKDIPSAYPQLDPAETSVSLVVARTAGGTYLPQFPECAKPDLICMDPPPFWMDTQVLSVIHGQLQVDRMAVATTSHYGLPEDDAADAMFLMRLETDGRWFVMPRYERARLYRDSSGKLYFPVQPYPIHWLPCSVRKLAREVKGLRGVDDLRIPRASLHDYGVGEHPHLFNVSWRGAMPRYWIAVAELGKHLAGLPKDTPWTCEDVAGWTKG